MKIVFAPDAFKDSLSAFRISEILKEKACKIFPGCEIQMLPLADGDKGTVDTLVSVLNIDTGKITVTDHVGDEIDVPFAVLDRETALFEAGALLRDQGKGDRTLRQKMLFSSSHCVGEAVLCLLNKGYRRIYLGAGNGEIFDGGMGCLGALGVRYYDSDGAELEPSGINLLRISVVDTTRLDKRMRQADIIVMCSVNNPLYGEQGAAYVYGAMCGGEPDDLVCLERGMRNFERRLCDCCGINVGEIPGTGASGGLPAALKAVCGAQLRSGISTVLKLIRFEEQVADASLVVVGEGRMDRTSVFGKAIIGIGMMCKAKGIPVVALTGQMEKDAEELYQYGVSSIISCVNTVMTEEEALEDMETLAESAAERMFRFLSVGMQMHEVRRIRK